MNDRNLTYTSCEEKLRDFPKEPEQNFALAGILIFSFACCLRDRLVWPMPKYVSSET
jgi:hypothetical protein